jgi:hypothetical protein
MFIWKGAYMSTHICMWLCLHAGCYLRGQQSINQGRARIRLMCIRQVIRTQMKRTSSSFYWVRNFLRSFKELGNTKVCGARRACSLDQILYNGMWFSNPSLWTLLSKGSDRHCVP